MIVKQKFLIKGIVCNGCEKIIEKQVLTLDGIEKITIDISTETTEVSYDDEKTTIQDIINKIEEKNYSCEFYNEKNKKNYVGWVVSIIGIMVIGYYLFDFVEGINLPTISQNMGYGLLFVVGLLTGFHCVGMCGGFVVSYTTKNAQKNVKSHKSHIMYGLGKTVSYTIIGAIFGLMGSIIAFTPKMRGIAGLLAGLFLVLFGLKMLNIFPALRKIQIKTPKILSRFVGKNLANSSPLKIGLLNGLMIACGPLQAIYIMAAGTGSAIEGAKLLLVFGLGTLPVMLSFGYLTSIISNKVSLKILKASGVIVIILGIIMINNGLVLTGTGYDFTSIIGMVTAQEPSNEIDNTVINEGFQEIRMKVDRNGWTPDKFVLKQGVPVKWIINGKEINGCNNAIQVPEYNLNFKIKQGEQIIEFTPDKEGTVRWSCWMGMIPGTFIVKKDIDLSNTDEIQKEISHVPSQPHGSCGCGSA